MRTVERRELLKSVVLGPGVLAAHRSRTHLSESPTSADDVDFSFHVLALGNGPITGDVVNRIFLVGSGLITSSSVTGGGGFQHYDANTPQPRRVLTVGQWEARRLLAARLIGRWGVFVAGTLVLEVDFSTADGRVAPATMKIVHNIIGPARLHTGETEGFTVTFSNPALGRFQTTPAQAPGIPVTELLDRAALRRGDR